MHFCNKNASAVAEFSSLTRMLNRLLKLLEAVVKESVLTISVINSIVTTKVMIFMQTEGLPSQPKSHTLKHRFTLVKSLEDLPFQL